MADDTNDKDQIGMGASDAAEPTEDAPAGEPEDGEERRHVTITLVSRKPRPAAEEGGAAAKSAANVTPEESRERAMRHFRTFEEHLDDLGGMRFDENLFGMWNEGSRGFIELARGYSAHLDEARWAKLDEAMADIALVHQIRPSLAVRRNPQGACTIHVFRGMNGEAAFAAFSQLDREASFDWVDESLEDPNPAPIAGIYAGNRIIVVEFPGIAATGRNAARLPGILAGQGVEATHRRYRADAKILYALETVGESRPLPDPTASVKTTLFVPEPGV